MVGLHRNHEFEGILIKDVVPKYLYQNLEQSYNGQMTIYISIWVEAILATQQSIPEFGLKLWQPNDNLNQHFPANPE